MPRLQRGLLWLLQQLQLQVRNMLIQTVTMMIKVNDAFVSMFSHAYHFCLLICLLVCLDLVLFIINKEFLLVIYKCIPTSFHCSSVIGEGEAVRRSAPVIVLGKAISSRIELLSRMIASKRSIPMANPP